MQPRLSLGIALGGFGAIMTAGFLEGLPGSIDQIHVVLVLVIVVVGAAAVGGRLAGATTAVLATASFDFFHLQPVRSFSIDSMSDLVTTALLLIVGLCVGELSSWGQRRAANADDKQQQIHRLRRVACLAAAGTPERELIDIVGAELIDCLHLERAHYTPGRPDPSLPAIEAGGGLDRPHYKTAAGGFALDPGGVALPVHAGHTVVGSFTLVPRPGWGVSLDHRIVASVMADQLGAALASASSQRT